MKRVGRYELDGEIGRGASGTVYRATDPAIGRTVAIKIIRLGDLADETERAQLRDRLFREARAAGALLHPNIVTIFDAGEDTVDGKPIAYLAMELVEGQPLNDRWRPDNLSASVIPNAALVSVLRQTAAALDFAHSRGVVHRDVKPANILIGTGLGAPLQAKILDFGIAKLASQQMTHSGMLVGTPNYMSPEQIEATPGTTLDGRSDQFSLAVLAYELLTGEKPFRGTSLPSLLYQITQQAPQAAHLLNPSLAPATSAVLQRALSKHPIARFRTCASFVEELERTLEAKPDWHALPAGSSADLATIATQRLPPTPVPTVTLPKPVIPAAPRPLPDNRPPSRLDERHRPGLHWAALLLIPALIIAGMFAYWAFDDSPVIQPTDSVAASSDGVRPTPMPGTEGPAPELIAPESTTDVATHPDPTAPAAAVQAEPGLPNFDSSEPTLIRIVTRPPGARTTIDNGTRSCTSPCSVLVDRGPHTVTYTLDTYRPLTRNFDVPKQTELEADLERATGTLMLRSTPAGAAITIDGNAMTQRTPAVITLPVGKHRLRLTVDGRPAYEEAFELKDQVITTLSVEW
jgi:serine/threonine protein kinase